MRAHPSLSVEEIDNMRSQVKKSKKDIEEWQLLKNEEELRTLQAEEETRKYMTALSRVASQKRSSSKTKPGPKRKSRAIRKLNNPYS